jgi:hypothetical protein
MKEERRGGKRREGVESGEKGWKGERRSGKKTEGVERRQKEWKEDRRGMELALAKTPLAFLYPGHGRDGFGLEFWIHGMGVF